MKERLGDRETTRQGTKFTPGELWTTRQQEII